MTGLTGPLVEKTMDGSQAFTEGFLLARNIFLDFTFWSLFRYKIMLFIH